MLEKFCNTHCFCCDYARGTPGDPPEPCAFWRRWLTEPVRVHTERTDVRAKFAITSHDVFED